MLASPRKGADYSLIKVIISKDVNFSIETAPLFLDKIGFVSQNVTNTALRGKMRRALHRDQ